MTAPVTLKPSDPIHFLGMGGFGISAIARVMYEMGYPISGCDMNNSPLLEPFREDNIPVYLEHSANHLETHQPSALVISSAIPESNPEVLSARGKGIPVYKRSDILGVLMQNKLGIAVAGTHGKTTTTAMLSYLLTHAGMDPTYIVGGVVKNLSTNAHAGTGDPFVIEADEYDGMFLGLKPRIIVLTSLEMDHPDMFADMDAVRALFSQFLALLPDDGLLVINTDYEETRTIYHDRKSAGLPVISYGFDFNEADWFAENIRLNDEGYMGFTVRQGRHKTVDMSLKIPGKHNVSNTLASIAVADYLGISPGRSSEIMTGFEGIGRRFDIIGVEHGVTIVDDYAHHPTAIQTTLEGARFRYPEARIWAVWQPHTFSRTKTLMTEFGQCFGSADDVLVTDVYRSRDKETFGITPEGIVSAIDHPSVRHIQGLDAMAQHLSEQVGKGDVVIVMSAGTAVRVSSELLRLLKEG